MPLSPLPAVLVEAGVPPSRVSNMAAAAALTGTELVMLIQGGLNVRSTASAVAGLAGVTPAILVESGAAAKISALGAAGALAGTEQVPINQGGTTVRTTVSAIAALATPAAPANSLQFNNAGVFGGSANATFDGVNTVTMHTATVSTGNLTVTPGVITTGNTNNMDFKTSGGTQFRVKHVAGVGSGNFLAAYGFPAGQTAGALEATGVDTNIQIVYVAKGTQGHFFLTRGISGATQFSVQDNGTGGDYLVATGGSTNAYLTATGGAVIHVNLTVKGGGSFYVWKTTPNSGSPMFQINNPSGTVANYIICDPSVAGTDPSITTGGTDAIRSLRVTTVGTTSHLRVQGFSATNPGVKLFAHNASGTAPDNWFELTPSVGSNTLTIAANGSGVNVAITLKPLGTGNVIFEPGTGTTLTQATATATTLNLYNTVATTVNAFGAATTLNMGASGSATTLTGSTFSFTGNTVTLFAGATGTLQCQAGATTVNVFNTNATTVNLAGAATTLTVGATTGTLALRNATITMANATGVSVGADPGGGNLLRVGGALTVNSATMIATKTSFTNGAAAQVGTLTNAPAAGDPTKWIPVDDNGTTRYIPAW